jgi:hypothetical protein
MNLLKLLIDKDVWTAAQYAAGYEKSNGSRKPYWLEVIEIVIYIARDINSQDVPFV